MKAIPRAHWFTAGSILAGVLALWMSAPAAARAAGGADATEFGIIAGKVSDRRGAPQAGVPVNILSPGGRVIARATTQTTGRFSVPQLKPGMYSAEVVSPSFLPYLKTAISVRAGGLALLDVSLYKLAESVELNIPGNVQQAAEDWKWMLRAQHPTRPVLRFQQEQPDWASPRNSDGEPRGEPHQRALHGTLKLTAGDKQTGFGQDSGLQTSFDMDYQLTATQSLGLTGTAGLRQGTPAASFHASWDRVDGDAATTHLTATVRQLFLPREYWVSQFGPDAGSGNRVQSATFGYAQERRLSAKITAEYGALLDMLSLHESSSRLSPYARVSYATARNGIFTVAYTGLGPRALPTNWSAHKQGSDQWLAIPQISAGESGEPLIETGRHAEVNWEQSWTAPLVRLPVQTEAAIFVDELNAPALTVSYQGGVDTTALGTLRDPYSNRHFLSGRSYRSPGARVAASAKLNRNLTVIAAYSYSGSLVATASLPAAEYATQFRDSVALLRNQSFVLKADSKLPTSGTRVITSYRWLPDGAVTLADPYNQGIGQADPYLSVYIIQPIPAPDILPGQFAAIADFSNLLAEGYLPFRTPGGGSGVLYPAARIFRGGFNFTF